MSKKLHLKKVSPLPLVHRRTGVKASIFLLPNIITITSLFFGLLAIKFAFDGSILGQPINFLYAAYAILFAALCDGLDGSVARLTHTQSSFGVQLDSLCDLVSFGVAPAILMYTYSLRQFDRLGFCVCFIYAACGALRLARFNVLSVMGKANKNFIGIPIPMAAFPLCMFIILQNDLSDWLRPDSNVSERAIAIAQFLTDPLFVKNFLLGFTFVLALGMVSTFEYFSTKSIRLPHKSPFGFFTGIIIALALLMTFNVSLVVSVFMFFYILHGPVLWLFKRNKQNEELFDAGDA